MKNPFVYDSPVTAESFVGRKKEKGLILNALLRKENVVLTSPQKFGKTSLIFEVFSQLEKEGCHCIHVDLLTTSTKQKFVEVFISALAKADTANLENITSKIEEFLPVIIPKVIVKGKDDIEIDIEITTRGSALDQILQGLCEIPELISQKKGENLVIAFDDFFEILNLDSKDIASSISKMIKFRKNVRYIFIGGPREKIERFLTEKTNPFYQIGKLVNLNKIEKKQFFNYIMEKFKSIKCKITPEIIEKILELTECHPYYTQMLCHRIWDKTLCGEEIDYSSIYDVFNEIVSIQSYGYRLIWENLSLKQKNLLIGLVKERTLPFHSQKFIRRNELGSPATVNKSLKVLSSKGIVKEIEGRYDFSDPFFREWLKNTARILK